MHDLISKKWPVYYTNGKESAMLTYYIAQYMVPAVVGKLFKTFQSAEIATYMWNTLGTGLLFLIILLALGIKKRFKIWGAFLILIFFNGCLIGAQAVASILYQGIIENDLHWLTLDGTSEILLQYRSNFVCMRWTPSQWIAPGVMIILLFRFKKQIQHYITLLMPMMLYATFPFAGIAFIAIGYVFCSWLNHKKGVHLGKAFSIENICMFCSLGIVLCLYLWGNIFGVKPDNISLHWTAYGKYCLLYIIFCFFEFGVYSLLIASRFKTDMLFIWTNILLCILPLFRMGYFNDLVMNTSIAGLFLLLFFMMEYLFNEGDNKSYFFQKGVLITLLCFASVYPTKELISVVKNNDFFTQQREDNLKTMEKFAVRNNDDVRADYMYNYYSYDLDNNIFYNFVAKVH